MPGGSLPLFSLSRSVIDHHKRSENKMNFAFKDKSLSTKTTRGILMPELKLLSAIEKKCFGEHTVFRTFKLT